MKKGRDILCIGYLGLAAIAAVVLTVLKPTYSSIESLQTLIGDLIVRAIILSAVILLYFGYGYHKRFPLGKEAWHKAYWILPCLISVLANFPFSALIQGTAVVDYPNYIWLLAIHCLVIGLLEELLFRAILLDFLLDWLKKYKHTTFLAVVLSSAIFALYHLLNLLVGANVFYTLLQVGYTFLTGAMFAIALLKTKNILYPIILHAIFDFGGFLIPMLGHGPFQDMVFWILTCVSGALVLAHCLYALYKMDKEEAKSTQ